MDNFKYCINSLFSKEGGYQNHSSDVGNYYNNVLIGTNFGITPKTWLAYFGYVPTIEDMKTISKAEAELLYYNLFWLPYGFNQIDNKYVANIVFDTFVLFSYFSFSQIVPFKDNKPNFDVLNSTSPDLLVNEIIANRIDMHHYRTSQNPGFEVFLQGWINRANSFKMSAQKITNYLPFAFVGLGAFLLYYYSKK